MLRFVGAITRLWWISWRGAGYAYIEVSVSALIDVHVRRVRGGLWSGTCPNDKATDIHHTVGSGAGIARTG